MTKTLESIGYTIYLQDALKELGRFLEERKYSKIFFLVDRHTAEHCLPLVQNALPKLTAFDVIEIEPGEENKNIDFCIGVWKMLLDFGADRKSLLINLGGGMVCDMGSFAAASYKRGIDFVQIPTTLLAQVDAAVGGKTGIDMDGVKNCIGTFTQPEAVFIEPSFLKTLENRQLIAGYAEMLKHGLITDKSYFIDLQSIDIKNISKLLIYKSLVIKNEIVKTDIKEQNLRKTLNFGHTIGHALESYFLESSTPLLHGEALAIGMICEAYLSKKLNGLTEDELVQICNCIKTKFPMISIPEEADSALLHYMQNDKKNEAGKIGFALLNKIGSCDYDQYASPEEIKNSLEFYRDLIRA
jgi:3-dehydroquinate synthase